MLCFSACRRASHGQLPFRRLPAAAGCPAWRPRLLAASRAWWRARSAPWATQVSAACCAAQRLHAICSRGGGLVTGTAVHATRAAVPTGAFLHPLLRASQALLPPPLHPRSGLADAGHAAGPAPAGCAGGSGGAPLSGPAAEQHAGLSSGAGGAGGVLWPAAAAVGAGAGGGAGARPAGAAGSAAACGRGRGGRGRGSCTPCCRRFRRVPGGRAAPVAGRAAPAQCRGGAALQPHACRCRALPGAELQEPGGRPAGEAQLPLQPLRAAFVLLPALQCPP